MAKSDNNCCGKTVTETTSTTTKYGMAACEPGRGTLQYIGARYVPVFATPVEWDKTRTYEHLMMVQNQGNTYISKQAVPVGIDLPITTGENDYWILMSNWSAQIEQYREEVEEYKGEVDALAQNVSKLENDEMRVVNFNCGGSITLVSTPDANFVIDVGYTTDIDSDIVPNYMNSMGITHIDAIYVTHFHEDHDSAINLFTPYCDETTKFYVQMEPTSENGQYAAYVERSSAFNAAISDAGLQAPTIPINGEKVRFNGTTVTCFNTRRAFKESYDSAWANNGNYKTRISGLNNYSLIVLVEHGNNSYIDCGDVEGEAQRLNAPFMKHAHVMKNPHHWANNMGYMEFFNRISPNLITTNYEHAYGEITNTPTPNSSILPSYIFRYIKDNGMDVFDTSTENVEVLMKNGSIISKTGHVVNAGQVYDIQTLRSSLPASYYNENPYILRFLKIEELIEPLKTLKNVETFILRGSDSFFTDSPLFNSVLNTMESTYPSTDAFYIKGGLEYIEIEARNVTSPYNLVHVFTEYNSDKDVDYGLRRFTHGFERFRIDLETPLAAGNQIPVVNDNLGPMLRSNILNVKLENGVIVPCTAYFGDDYVNGFKRFSGVMVNRDSSYQMYNVIINGRTLDRCRLVNLAANSQSVTEQRVVAIWSVA